ncbi:unnamed protein product [Caenorhabditis bovis]|uniref:histone deacetylase n=1 Tax=Caenorhabditis bovis TaxID=2654633 RepID=A0A8S1F0I0_9PELO|nr:unnamed protein product [Caenorhabditis bovis]
MKIELPLAARQSNRRGSSHGEETADDRQWQMIVNVVKCGFCKMDLRKGAENPRYAVNNTIVGFNTSQEKHRNTINEYHPESSDRIKCIKKVFEDSNLLEKCKVLTDFPELDTRKLHEIHTKEYIEKLQIVKHLEQTEINSFCSEFDSVFMTQETVEAAKEGVACVRELAYQIAIGEATNGFAVVRPPGHHADEKEACGFCIFNNVAQAASVALECGAKRVLIVDLDVHHGQGTQRIFYEDKRVLYFSIHRYQHGTYWPHLPESDFDHIGKDEGLYYNANVPLNETGCGDSDYLAIFFNVLLPMAIQFNPHFVIVSAGFDSLQGDPIGQMNLTPDGYSHLIHHLKLLAQGRLLLVLEGGYNHEVSAVAAHRCLRVLLGKSPYPIDVSNPPKKSVINSCLSSISVLQNIDLETRIYINGGHENHFDDDDDDHPENPERIPRIIRQLQKSELIHCCTEVNCDRVATDNEILLVHTQEMLENLKRTKFMSKEQLGEQMRDHDSIFFTNETFDVATKTVGTVLQNPLTKFPYYNSLRLFD